MTWANKNRDWDKLAADIQSEIEANKHIIPENHVQAILHYFNHGEYSMAFEYLYLEIMEREEEGSVFSLGSEKALEIALFFDLNDIDWCMVDGDFWPKFINFLDHFKEKTVKSP